MQKLSNRQSTLTPPKRLSRALQRMLLLATLSTSLLAETAAKPDAEVPASICLVGSANAAFNTTFMTHLQQSAGNSLDLKTVSPDGSEKGCKIVVSIGLQALEKSLAWLGERPVIATFVTEEDFRTLIPESQQSKPAMAIYDQPPLPYQAALGRAILPAAGRVALLVSPGREEEYQAFVRMLERYGLEGQAYVVEHENELIQTLGRALNYGDFLLATPDPEIFNRRTIKHILLTAYRHNRIVIGPQRAYVRAGSLASVYVPLEAISRAVVRAVDQYLETDQLPASYFPDDYAVSVNRQVARSLNILIPDDAQLIREIRQRLNETDEASER